MLSLIILISHNHQCDRRILIDFQACMTIRRQLAPLYNTGLLKQISIHHQPRLTHSQHSNIFKLNYDNGWCLCKIPKSLISLHLYLLIIIIEAWWEVTTIPNMPLMEMWWEVTKAKQIRQKQLEVLCKVAQDKIVFIK